LVDVADARYHDLQSHHAPIEERERERERERDRAEERKGRERGNLAPPVGSTATRGGPRRRGCGRAAGGAGGGSRRRERGKRRTAPPIRALAMARSLSGRQ
jgi:hypothetical protein